MGAARGGSSGPHLPAHAIGLLRSQGRARRASGSICRALLVFRRFPPDAGLAPSWLDPARSACAIAGGEVVAWFGQLHRQQAQQRKLRQAVFAGEVYLDRLYRFPLRQPIAGELSRFQPVERDFSFVFPTAVRWRADRGRARWPASCRARSLCSARDLSTAAKADSRPPRRLPAGHFSILIGVTFQSPGGRSAIRNCRAIRNPSRRARSAWRQTARLAGCGKTQEWRVFYRGAHPAQRGLLPLDGRPLLLFFLSFPEGICCCLPEAGAQVLTTDH